VGGPGPAGPSCRVLVERGREPVTGAAPPGVIRGTPRVAGRQPAPVTLPDPLLSALPPGIAQGELRLVERAYHVAAYWHRSRLRNTPCTLVGELREEFGEAVSGLVAKMAGFDWAECLREPDPGRGTPIRRLVALTAADRLHNLRTAAALAPARRRRASEETLAVFVPLARRFGMDDLTRELEGIARATLRAYPHPEPGEAAVVGEDLRVPLRTLRAAALLLPTRSRARWLEEWLGEIHALPRGGRTRFVAQLVYGMPRLAVTLRWHTASGRACTPRRRSPPLQSRYGHGRHRGARAPPEA
jgi:HD domain